MITISQFDDLHTEADIAAMNKIIQDVLNHFEINTDYFSASEVMQITNVVEGRVVERFIDLEMGCSGDYADLLPANWRRLVSSRTA